MRSAEVLLQAPTLVSSKPQQHPTRAGFMTGSPTLNRQNRFLQRSLSPSTSQTRERSESHDGTMLFQTLRKGRGIIARKPQTKQGDKNICPFSFYLWFRSSYPRRLPSEGFLQIVVTLGLGCSVSPDLFVIFRSLQIYFFFSFLLRRQVNYRKKIFLSVQPHCL